MDHIYRHDLSVLRDSLRRLGAVVAEVDQDLRYVWIDNPHPDFDGASVVGRRDDELIPAEEAEPIMRFKRDAWRIQAPLGLTLQFRRSDGSRAYTLMAYPVIGEGGEMESVLTVGFETKSS